MYVRHFANYSEANKFADRALTVHCSPLARAEFSECHGRIYVLILSS